MVADLYLRSHQFLLITYSVLKVSRCEKKKKNSDTQSQNMSQFIVMYVVLHYSQEENTTKISKRYFWTKNVTQRNVHYNLLSVAVRR